MSDYDDNQYNNDETLPHMEDEGNIHKDETDDFVVSEETVEGQHQPDDFRDDFYEDEPKADDDDVPFHLPKYDEADRTQPHNPVVNQFKTVPTPSSRHSAPTLPDSGGLDPNPDIRESNATVPHLKQASTTAPHHPPDHEKYRRQSDQRDIPGVPKNQVGKRRLPLRRRKRRRSNLGCVVIFISIFLSFCGGLTLMTSCGLLYGYVRIGELLDEEIDEVEDYASFQSTFLFDRDAYGRSENERIVLYEIFGEGRRTNVGLDEMPQYLINATIAIEDDSFYQNIGIDIAATTVAFLQFLGAEPDENTPGGSTITQQLVRNVLFSPEYRAERSTQRKVEEILLAIALTGRKSKDDILELYLNEIYYGNLAYGSQAASQVFFGKDVGDLTLGEAAMLAGLPQAPAELDPFNLDPEVQAAVYARWRQVLNEMVEEGYITDAQRNEALNQGLAFASQGVSLNAPHFTVYAQNELEILMNDLGYSSEYIARGGLTVYTTVDLEINQMAQEIAAQQVATLASEGHNISNAAVIIIKPATGEILGMVGSIDYNNDVIDGRVNVTTAFRQPGSTMKPFTYSAALELGMTAGDVIWDTRTSIGIPGQQAYVPRNYDSSFHGPMAMRSALANSYNIPAVQTLRSLGPDGVQYLLNLMHRFGVDSMGTDASIYGLSLTLGGGEVSLLELTRAYAVFSNQGMLVDTTSISCILDIDKNIIYQYENGCPEGNVTALTVNRFRGGIQTLDPRIAFLISDILSDNNARTPAMGSNSVLHTPGIVTSVKTGTTNDVKDNWTVGYTRSVAVGVWVGNNNGDPMINSSGLSGAAPIWNQVINRIYSDSNMRNSLTVDGQLLSDQLQPSVGMSLRQICNVRALQDPATGCPGTISEWFLDSPAGLPNGQGGMNYPPPPNTQVGQIPSSGSYVQEYGPGIYRTVVYPLAPDVANAIQFGVNPGERPPPPPLYCRVPMELISTTPGVQEQLFIAPPPVPADAADAEEYARNHGLAFLPTIDCTPQIISTSNTFPTAGNYPPVTLTAYITSPTPNQVITDMVPIIGTANFAPEQAKYYVFEIVGGQFPDWVRIQQPHYNGIVDGQMEFLPGPPGLEPGNYQLRLLIINHDDSVVQQPYVVPFTVP